jgi:cell division protein FtsW
MVWLFAVYSVSVFESFWLTLYRVEQWLRSDPTNYFYFIEQIINIAAWVLVCVLIYLIPRRVIKKMKNVIFLLTLGAVLLLFTPFALTYKGATAWLDLWFTNIQPGEFFKLWFVLFLWSWLLRKRSVMNELTWYIWFLIITGVCYLIFVLIPDLGTVYVLAPVSLLMFWYAWGRKTYILLTFWIGIVAMFLAATQFNHIRVRLDYYLLSK